jgi:uncharacterized protein (TIGR00730 family)
MALEKRGVKTMKKKAPINYLTFLWKIHMSFAKLLWGMWKISRIKRPAISIFGSARFQEGDHYYQKAYDISKKLVENGFAVLSGGNSGIMEGTAKGAVAGTSGQKKPHLFGIGVEQMPHLPKSPYATLNPFIKDFSVLMPHLFSRKVLLTRGTAGIIAFPGGIGTLDEFFEAIQLKQTKRMSQKPIVLIGKDHWQPLLDYFKNHLLANSFIAEKDTDLFVILDDTDEIVDYLTQEIKPPSSQEL